MSVQKWFEQHDDFLRGYVPGHHHNEIYAEFIKTFPETNFTASAVRARTRKLKLITGYSGLFEKGSIPANKGQKLTPEQYEKASKTMFKKGHISANTRKVGDERLSKDGYVEVKVPNQRRWKMRSRLVWEQINGEIPEKHIIFHLNGDRTDDGIENLRLVSCADMARVNQNHLTTSDPEVNEICIAWAKLKTEIGKRKRGKDETEGNKGN